MRKRAVIGYVLLLVGAFAIGLVATLIAARAVHTRTTQPAEVAPVHAPQQPRALTIEC